MTANTPMTFDLKNVLNQYQGQAQALHEKYVNTVFAHVLDMIGFAHEYTEGKGCYLTTRDGRTIFDGLSGYGVFGMGRNHPTVIQAIEQALALDLPNLVQMDTFLLSGLLAERLIRIAPGNRLQHVFFTNSGTEAAEGAIKFARAATGRPRILFSQGAFHGLTTGALALNGDASFREGFGDLLPGTEAVDWTQLEALEYELKKKNVAAVVLEPIRGKGVYYPPDDRVYPTLQRLCRENGTLFIVDEIQSGLGRTGRWWACQHWDLEPDILLCAKALSGGLVPIGAILYSDAVYRGVFSRLDRCVVHSSTFGQNALAMVAGLAALHVLEEENLVERSARQGDRLLAGLRELQKRHELLHEIRGKGLMVGVEFGPPKSLRLKPAWTLLHTAQNGLFAQAVVMRLYQTHHILTQVAGHHQEVVKFLPPFIITDEEVDRLVSALDEVLQECSRFPGPVWSVGKQLAGAAVRQHLFGRESS
ncbi:MAG TPA: aspartate aminotransferase family protein [bacterium]|nr:aspartate aminotransferase family protein [bacterium]HOL95717.1 aspartate aminotransferase family protein [bacterium]HPP02356.1 aspartate aminotransferase family protein [bacterium]